MATKFVCRSHPPIFSLKRNAKLQRDAPQLRLCWTDGKAIALKANMPILKPLYRNSFESYLISHTQLCRHGLERWRNASRKA